MSGEPTSAEFKVMRNLQEQLANIEAENARLKGGDGGNTSDTMDGRVSRLEAHMEHVREDMTEIKSSLGTVLGKLNDLPTRSDLWSWKWQWAALAFATIAITIGGIIGGLAWIKPDAPAAPTQPIVITVPGQAPTE